ncbi:MAG: tryptophan synthase subunit alpha, partial [Alphaproteobacteria bacterium]|nr:tryptophan synthase subunit alpha [Alphaproteobacteria bacterium]
AQQAAEVAKAADSAVVGSVIVDRLDFNLDPSGNAKPGLIDAVLSDVRALAAGVRSARHT